MADTSIRVGLQGVDKTGGAFASVAKRADAAMGAFRRIAGVAIGALAVGKITGAAVSAVNALGLISDQAQRIGTSAVYAQQLERALQHVGVVGVNMDNLASAFGRMQKETGASGAKGFEDQMRRIAGMGDEQARVNELVRVFGGEMGGKFAHLVRQGPDAFAEGLAGVMAAMPAVSESAVAAGDAAADALALAGATAKVAWQQAMGDMAASIQDKLGMSLSEAMGRAIAYVRWFAAVAWEHIKTFGENVKRVAQFFTEDWKGALKWVWNGFTGFFSAVWDLFKSIFLAVKNVAVEFGKQFWNWVTGKDADWGAIWERAVEGAKDAAAKARGVLEAAIPRGNDKIQFASVDQQALDSIRDAREAAVTVAAEGAKAVEKLASGKAAAETAAAEGARQIDEAAKNASYTSASSYEYVKAAAASIAARRAAGMGTIMAAGMPGATAGMARTAEARQGQEMLETLRRLLNVTSDGWAAAARIGVV